ncbi:Peptidyl-prolyl cis-trans isomerase B [Candida viswanathii]|uniref:Peptidyl-prolyl cis-trans isomerase n=1 Tax=Candida viswanathii TaxID=5486 RepID=A0A367YEI1_9ASCO|nr:Peptidyl-prolyl cis-trans isomerase B [Candida viswanathii]
MMKLLTSIALIVSLFFAFFSQSVFAGDAAAGDLPENPPITNRVYLDVEEDGKPLGRITIGLFGTVVPKTAENFRVLCTGEMGASYKDTIFHRVIKNFMIQSGDFEYNQGYGGYSPTHNNGKFDDENFELKHDRKYRLSMANAGKNTNGSQFFITTALTKWLDGAHVVFGEVLDGKDVVDHIESAKTGRGDRPVKEIKIVASGELTEDGEEAPSKDEL